MSPVFEGELVSHGGRFAIVVARFNAFITRQLLEGALDAFRRHGVGAEDIDIAWVPGAFEVPLVAQKLAATGRYRAVVCLAAVIRGATPHFEYVASAATRGVLEAGLATGIPVIFGVLTTDTVEQAIERAGTKAGNKGYEAALAALEMANLMQRLSEIDHG